MNILHLVYSFPTDQPRRADWIKAVRRTDADTKKDWQPSKYSVLCSENFLPTDFRFDRGYAILNSEAIPSVFNFPRV